jgi:lipoprotein-releasing system permease protein
MLLCWRYLLTRYLALVCIVSVLLGVATLIVVNSVMSGFSTKLKQRLHGLLSDIDIEARQYSGFGDPYAKMDLIRSDPYLNEQIEAMTPTQEIFGILQYSYQGGSYVRPVHIIGIDIEGRAKIGGFREFLVNEQNRQSPSFRLSPEAQGRYEANHPPDWQELLPPDSGDKPHAEPLLPLDIFGQELPLIMPDKRWPRVPPECKLAESPLAGASKPPAAPEDSAELSAADKPSASPAPAPLPPPEEPYVPESLIAGHALVTYRNPDPTIPADSPDKEFPLLRPGDVLELYTISGEKLTPAHAKFVLCDTFKTELSEYDGNYVYVPLKYLQQLRSTGDRVTSIQIKLKDYDQAPMVLEALKKLFHHSVFQVQTWEQKQGPLLAAIAVEKGILNVLLFLIIAVAGFGILAIFSMIVVEKTRDIGILKALGASNGGVMKIFLGYGLLLGVVGSALGTVLGLAFTRYINEIEQLLARLTGQEIFDRSIYYFDKIPTDIQPTNVVLINIGALTIAVLFSILPALRAAMLHPVRALRYE